MSSERRRRRGATGTAYDRTLAVARHDGRIHPCDGAAVAVGRAAAQAVDATTDGTPWERVAVLRQTLEVLRELQLTPASRPHEANPDPLAVPFQDFVADEQQRTTTRPQSRPKQDRGVRLDKLRKEGG